MGRSRTRTQTPLELFPSEATSGFLPLEQRLLAQGFSYVAGVDEAGRGCLAGPVVAAAVIFAPQVSLPGVNDSKVLSAEAREALFLPVQQAALAFGIGQASAQEIDQINILQATFLAMRRALEQLQPAADFVLVDGNQSVPILTPQRTVVQGDARCFSIAAASILAKVARDRLMVQAATQFPGYGFELHKGYGTDVHREAIVRLGPTLLHRLTFRGAGGPT